MRRRGARRVRAWFLGVICGALASGQAFAEPLRICADPNGLPYSNQRGEGFENELAVLLAEELGRELDYLWWPQRRGFLRQLREGRCDAVMGIPVDHDRVSTSRAYYRSSYVFLSREDLGFSPKSLNSPGPRNVRIGVHLIGDDYANSPPAHALAARGIVENVVGFSVFGDYAEDSPPRTLVDAVGKGEIDVAIVWGPIGGFFAWDQPVPLRMDILETAPEDSEMRFVFEMAVAVKPGNESLRDLINQALEQRSQDVARLLARFGIPVLQP